ncbi:MAG: hybrid sensor histidine kinase/response regulator [Myxococcaceae bacterium]|jgi:signal transduction histidine kinase|nr:hybrid sensor histidine kinase/response regulator [Myxococcaceae bacterium]
MAAPAHIAVVDDDPGSRKTAADLLTPLGHDVRTWASGSAFLEGLSAQVPDLVLCDVMMPGLDGFEVTRRLRQRSDLGAMPIVLVTALDGAADRVAGLEAGADDFLSKPVHGPELRARVTNLLQVGAYRKWLEAEREAARRQVGEVQQQLFHAERLATLGTFAAGISHELKNIVAVFSSMLGTLEKAPGGYLLDDEAHQALKQSTQHAAELAQSVLKVSRVSGPAEVSVDLPSVVKDVVSMMRAAGRTRHIDVRVLVPADAPLARATPLEAQQVLLNLLGNACDALGHARTARIDVQVVAEGDRLRLTVADNGPGMPPEVRERLFTPFFTTKPPGQGTGLGLMVLKQIVTRWDGDVRIDSAPGQGTAVHVRLHKAPPLAE